MSDPRVPRLIDSLRAQAHGLRTASSSQFGPRMVRAQRYYTSAMAWVRQNPSDPLAGRVRSAAREVNYAITSQARARNISVASLETRAAGYRAAAAEHRRQGDSIAARLRRLVTGEPSPAPAPAGGKASPPGYALLRGSGASTAKGRTRSRSRSRSRAPARGRDERDMPDVPFDPPRSFFQSTGFKVFLVSSGLGITTALVFWALSKRQ